MKENEILLINICKNLRTVFRWDGQQFQTISDMCSNGIMGDMQSNNKNIILVCLHEKLVEIV